MKTLIKSTTNQQSALESLIDEFFSPMTEYSRFKSDGVTQKVTEKSLNMSFEIPGVEKDSIKIEVEQNKFLTVKAVSNSNEEYEKTETNYKWSYTLPSIYDTETIEAEYKNGVLYLIIPKKDDALIKKTIEIK